MLSQPGALIITRHEPMLVQASESTKASLLLMVCETGAPGSISMCLDCSRHLGAPRPHRCRCWASPDTQGMSQCWSRHPFAARPAGADGVQDKCAHHYKHEPRQSEAPWRSKVAMVPMLCQLGAPSSTRQGSKLVQASVRTKASLVLTACETCAPRCTTMCLDCSRHLGNQWHHWCRCCPRQVPLDKQGMSRCWSRHALTAGPCWWRWCA